MPSRSRKAAAQSGKQTKRTPPPSGKAQTTKASPQTSGLSAQALKKAGEAGNAQTYVLRLFVTGTTRQSLRAIRHIQSICQEYLKGRHKLEIVDIYQQPHLALEENLVAAPTLVKQLPEPLRRLIGDMSDKERVLAGLALKPRQE